MEKLDYLPRAGRASKCWLIRSAWQGKVLCQQLARGVTRGAQASQGRLGQMLPHPHQSPPPPPAPPTPASVPEAVAVLPLQLTDSPVVIQVLMLLPLNLLLFLRFLSPFLGLRRFLTHLYLLSLFLVSFSSFFSSFTITTCPTHPLPFHLTLSGMGYMATLSLKFIPSYYRRPCVAGPGLVLLPPE